MIISDIDFAAMYRRHMSRSDRPAKPASEWDARARSLSGKVMSRDVPDSGYTHEFVRRMQLQGAGTLLDIGCGPGTIALAVASQMERVTGLDYSPAMLECMQENAVALGLDNVDTCLRAWEDDWDDVPVCDIVVASRSSMVPDMELALRKMTAHARQRCYMTHLAGGHFGDASVATAMGRQQRAFPDYIYIINILYGMGLHPCLDYIELPGRLAGTSSFDEFVQKVAWSFGELSENETQRLQEWYDADPVRARQGGDPMRWAFIAWNVP